MRGSPIGRPGWCGDGRRGRPDVQAGKSEGAGSMLRLRLWIVGCVTGAATLVAGLVGWRALEHERQAQTQAHFRAARMEADLLAGQVAELLRQGRPGEIEPLLTDSLRRAPGARLAVLDSEGAT